MPATRARWGTRPGPRQRSTGPPGWLGTTASRRTGASARHRSSRPESRPASPGPRPRPPTAAPTPGPPPARCGRRRSVQKECHGPGRPCPADIWWCHARSRRVAGAHRSIRAWPGQRGCAVPPSRQRPSRTRTPVQSRPPPSPWARCGSCSQRRCRASGQVFFSS